MTRDEESRVIRAVLAGDTYRFEELVHASEKGIYNLCLRMLGNEQDALDASQEAYFKAFRALPTFRGESKFSVWLYRLASNVCLDMLRKRPAAPALPLEDEEGSSLPLPDNRFDPQAALERKELRRAVREALADLPPDFRQVLVLRELNGLSYEEIGQVTGLEAGTVKSRIFRARKKMAALLTVRGNFSPETPSISSEIKTRGKGGEDA